jgi:hypothetical protein
VKQVINSIIRKYLKNRLIYVLITVRKFPALDVVMVAAVGCSRDFTEATGG